MSSEPSQTNGQARSMKGSMVETIGNVTGSESWKQSGKKEHDAGEGEYKAAQTADWAEGVGDRIHGRFDAVMGAVKGDKAQQTAGNTREGKGEAQQHLNE